MVLERGRKRLDERVKTGIIVEAHGDRRPEYICLAPEVAFLNCLEFSRNLPMVNAADELVFLALECEPLGAAKPGALQLHTCSEIPGD